MTLLFYHTVCDQTLQKTPLTQPYIYSCVAKAATCSIYGAIAQQLGIVITNPDRPDHNQEWKSYHHYSLPFPRDSYFHFSFVRNPFETLVSYWSMRKYQTPFSDWARKVLVPTQQDLHIQSQLRTLKPLPHFIGRFETLQRDWKYVQTLTGLPDLPHYNKSKHRHYREYYDQPTKALVEAYYQEELNLFGYEF